ncbi:MAG TPA: ATP synthase F1 subunit delta [Bacteroidota bacterium]|nr:ATP synthase F1 subunit delta [Bacteroidota bacterium]
MADSRAALRYARALLGTAQELKQLDAVNTDVLLIDGLLKGSREFRLFMQSPVINTQRKKSVFTEVLKGNVSELMFSFLILLASKKREMIVPEIIEQFKIQYDELRGIMNVTLRSVSKFSPEQNTALVKKLQDATKKTVRLEEVTDAALIGGFTVSYGDTVLDGSVLRQLAVLKQQLTEA